MSDFLPTLATLLPVEKIPGDFGVFQSGLNNIFSNLYFRDLEVKRS